MSKPETIEVYKETSQDWCPSYELLRGKKLLNVSFNGPVPPRNEYLACVWGNDDMGMQFVASEREQAFGVFLELLELKDVTVEECMRLGLKSA